MQPDSKAAKCTHCLCTLAIRPAWACRFEGQHILVVDKVDDSRASLASFITTLQGRLDALKAAAGPGQWKDAHVGVFVLHNKRRPKAADLPSEVLDGRCAGDSMPPLALCSTRIGSPRSCTCWHMLFFSGLFLALVNVVLTPSHQQLDNT